MAALPWNFYMLTSLVELRMDANPTSADEVSRRDAGGGLFFHDTRLLQGAEAVRNWFKKRQKQALFARKHRIVATMQDFMEQCKEVRPSIAHQGYFEAGVERSGAVWFQVVWDKFWDEMLPGLRDAWAEKRVDKHRVTAMPFSRSEVQKVLEDYKDAEGKVYMKDQVCMFKRCRCVDADGNKKSVFHLNRAGCVKGGRILFKCRVILQREKRMMDERKREEAAIQQAVENARVAATAFCHSEEGIQRFRKRARSSERPSRWMRGDASNSTRTMTTN